MSEAITWGTFEDAIFSWIVSGSSAPAKRVYWMHHRSPRADSDSTPFVTMMFDQFDRFGHDWIDIENNPDPSPGAEILKIARGLRLITVSVEFFASSVPEGYGALGIAVAANVMAQLPLFRDVLRAAGVGVLGFGPARGSPIKVPVGLDPRARMDIYINIASQVAVPDTFIEFVDVTATEPSWEPGQPYIMPTTITNAGKLYQLIVNGTSAGSGGPTTRDADITDGTAHWKYIGDGTGSDIWSPYDPTP